MLFQQCCSIGITILVENKNRVYGEKVPIERRMNLIKRFYNQDQKSIGYGKIYLWITH